MASTYEPIASTTLGGSASTIDFTSIAGSWTDLRLIISPVVSSATTIGIRVGNSSVDTGSNYSSTFLYGTGSSAASARVSSQTILRVSYAATARTTNDGGDVIVDLMSYASTSVYKTVLAQGGIASEGVDRIVGLWRSTSAITEISVLPVSGGSILASGMTASLFGIKAA